MDYKSDLLLDLEITAIIHAAPKYLWDISQDTHKDWVCEWKILRKYALESAKRGDLHGGYLDKIYIAIADNKEDETRTMLREYIVMLNERLSLRIKTYTSKD